MSSALGTSKGILEIAKFGVYLAVPAILTYLAANNSPRLQKFMSIRPYVTYPEDCRKPPSPEEIREMAREIARKNKAP